MAGRYLSLLYLALIILVAVLVLGVWVIDPDRKTLRQIASARYQHNNLFGRRFWIPVVAGRHFENGVNCIAQMRPKDRAETYLRRIAVLTGATQVGSYYVLNVGKAQFYVKDRYVRRVPTTKDRTVERGETCFYPSQQDMPAAEKIATALLQLKNNPGLFDKWVVQSGLFKADGKLFET